MLKEFSKIIEYDLESWKGLQAYSLRDAVLELCDQLGLSHIEGEYPSGNGYLIEITSAAAHAQQLALTFSIRFDPESNSITRIERNVSFAELIEA